jgi:hypothetical protein
MSGAAQWKPISGPSENLHLVETPHQRIYHPQAGVHIHNGRAKEREEVLLGGYETEGGASTLSLKLYQPGSDVYDRVRLPVDFVEMEQRFGSCPKKDADKIFAGMGADCGLLAIAGGTPYPPGSSDLLFGHEASTQVLIASAETRRTERIADMKEGRVAPNVTLSPDGRFVLVSGGIRREGWGANGYRDHGAMKALDSVEIYDRGTKRWIDVDDLFPGLSKMPRPRWGGSVSWVQDDCGVDRIIFAGGADHVEPQHGQPNNSEPTHAIDVYDVRTHSWLQAELDTPRFNPGIAKHPHADGVEVVVGGGTTGKSTIRNNEQAQLYSTEKIDVATLAVTPGEHLPVQRAISTGMKYCNVIEFGPTALVFETGRSACDCKATEGALRAYYFGFRSAATTQI